MKTKIAIVGLGKMGLMHASIFRMLEEVELAAICEKSTFIRKFGSKAIPNIPIVADLESLRAMKLDAVIITTPPNSHFPIIRTVLENGIAKNILTEKPLAVSLNQAEGLCDLVDRHHGVNMVGYQCRFTVTYLKAKQILDAGEIGELASFEAKAYSADFLGVKSSSKAIGRGGVLEDLGSHIIDLVHWFLGDISVTESSIRSIIADGSIDEVNLSVKMPRDLVGSISVSWCKEGYRLPEIMLVITGSKGTLSVNGDKVEFSDKSGKKSLWYRQDLNDTATFYIGGAEYRRQDESFVQAIRQCSQVEPNFRTAAAVQKVIDQANRITEGTRL